MAASATKGDRRLILVVNGLPSKKTRRKEPDRLFAWGFREFNNYKLFGAGEKITDADVWLGQQASVPLVIETEMLLTLPRKARRKMKVSVQFENPVPAPVSECDRVATLVVSVPGEPAVEVPLVAAHDVKRLGLLGRLGTALNAIIWGNIR